LILPYQTEGFVGIGISPTPIKCLAPKLGKFVEIGAGDCEEFDAVEKRQVGAQGFVKDTLVKFEPGEFAIDVGRFHEI